MMGAVLKLWLGNVLYTQHKEYSHATMSLSNSFTQPYLDNEDIRAENPKTYPQILLPRISLKASDLAPKNLLTNLDFLPLRLSSFYDLQQSTLFTYTIFETRTQ